LAAGSDGINLQIQQRQNIILLKFYIMSLSFVTTLIVLLFTT